MTNAPTNTTTEPSNSTTPTDTLPATMRAIVQRSYGSADQLELAIVDRPAIAADEVLIEVHAAGVDRGVWHLMTGSPYLIRIAGFGLTKPKQPIQGLDVAGRVVAVGSDVTRFSPGDEVFGIASGSFAEYAAAKEDKLARKPSTATFEQAAASAISGITALQALTDVGKVQAGQHVLVIGASGGVGTFAVQLAKALGAQVTGVASTAKLDLVRSLGADHVVDYTSEDATDGSRAVRPDHRHRRPHAGPPAPPRPDQPGNTRHRRRRGRRPLDRRYRPATASDAAVTVHQTAPHHVHQQRGPFVDRAARRVHRDRRRRPGRRRNASPSRTPPMPSARWRPARHAASPSSSSAPMETTVTPEPARRSTLRRVLPFAWLALSAMWAAVILITDQLAWPLALWIATTVGPLTALDRRSRHHSVSNPDVAPGVPNPPGTPSDRYGQHGSSSR